MALVAGTSNGPCESEPLHGTTRLRHISPQNVATYRHDREHEPGHVKHN